MEPERDGFRIADATEKQRTDVDETFHPRVSSGLRGPAGTGVSPLARPEGVTASFAVVTIQRAWSCEASSKIASTSKMSVAMMVGKGLMFHNFHVFSTTLSTVSGLATPEIR